MSTRTFDIPPDEWSRFFEELTQEHRGGVVIIDMNASGSEGRLHLQDVSFEGISLVLNGNEEAVSIVVREDVRKHMTYTVNAPFHVTYEEVGGVAKSLQVESEDGETTIVKFRSASVPETVQGQTTSETD